MKQERKIKIANLKIASFLQQGFEPMPFNQFNDRLNKIKSIRVYSKALQVFFLCLYLTGRKPSELLRLIQRDLKRKGNYLSISFKSGELLLPFNNLTAPINDLAVFDNTFLFWALRSKNKDLGHRIFRHSKKWFGVSPSFFKKNLINRFVELDASSRELYYFLGTTSKRKRELANSLTNKEKMQIADRSYYFSGTSI